MAIKFDEEYDRLGKILAQNNTIAMFLAAHMLLERRLKRLIEFNVPRPEQFSRARLKLATLVYIAAGMGFLEDYLVEALLYVDNVRHNLAHNFDYQLTREVTSELERIFRKADMQIVRVDTLHEEFEAYLLSMDTLVLEKMPRHIRKAVRASGRKRERNAKRARRKKN